MVLLYSGPLSAYRPQSIPGRIEAALAAGGKYRNVGNFEKAINAFQKAAEEAHLAGDDDREATARWLAGGCQIRLFRYAAALQSSETARELASRVGNYTVAGASSVNLSTIYVQLGDFALAKKEADHSVDLLQHSPRKDLFAKALLNYGDMQSQSISVDAGRQSYDRAIAAAREARRPDLEGMAEDHLGTSLLLEGRLKDADAALQVALSVRRSIQDRDGLAITNEHFAELELKKGNYAAALMHIDEAFASPSPLFKTNPQYYPLHIRGLILLRLHRNQEALAQFRRAVDSANQWRQSALPGDATGTQTVAYLHSTYQDYAELAAELALLNHDPVLARQALETLAENRAASLREQVTLALGRNLRLPARYFDLLSEIESAQSNVTLNGKSDENEAKLVEIRLELYRLENKIGIENANTAAANEKNPHKNSLKDIQERLSDNQALLSFCLGEGKSYLWAVTKEQVNLYELPKESEIRESARDFTDQLQKKQNTPTPGRLLSREIFGKLGSQVEQKRDWLITADGPLLNSLPFSALPAASDANAFLIATHTLRFLPSELLLTISNSVGLEQRFVGVADPIYNFADRRAAGDASLAGAKHNGTSVGLARLVGSQHEIDSAAKTSGMPKVQLLVGRNASGTVLRAALANRPTVVHFAVHVVSPDKNPQQAALALSLTKDGVPELLTPEEIATYRVPGSLVILSGCSSGEGEVLPSAGLIGLSRAWLLAGADAVIVSAWPTPDDSGRFFSDFYRHFQELKSGSLAERAALSLQQAQLDMQRSQDYRSSSSFWAAYSVISKE